MLHIERHLRKKAIRFPNATKLAPLAVLALALGRPLSADVSQPSIRIIGQQVIEYLNQSIDWYRHLPVEEDIATDPTDILFVNDDRQMAGQIVRLSFDFGRSAAQVLAAQAPPPTNQAPTSSRFQNLLQAAARTDEVIRQTQAEIDEIRAKLDVVRGRERQKVEVTLDELQSELALAQARSEALHSILQFTNTGSTSTSSGNVLAQVQELQRSVPEVTIAATTPAGEAQNKAATASAANTSAGNIRRQQPSGLLALVTDLFSLTRKIHTLDESIRTTEALAQTAQNLRTPLRENISALVQRGNVLAQQADISDVAGLRQQKRELDALTAQFKQTSSMMLPLSKQSVLFDLYKSNLTRWRSAVKTQYHVDLKNLGLRLMVLTLVLGARSPRQLHRLSSVPAAASDFAMVRDRDHRSLRACHRDRIVSHICRTDHRRNRRCSAKRNSRCCRIFLSDRSIWRSRRGSCADLRSHRRRARYRPSSYPSHGDERQRQLHSTHGACCGVFQFHCVSAQIIMS